MVAIERALVILRAGEKQEAPPVHERMDAALLAFEKLLNHHLRARVAELPLLHDLANRSIRLGVRRRDDHPFAERQPTRLHDDGRVHFRSESTRFLRGGKLSARRRRDAVAEHKLLRKHLRRFQPRRALCRTENAQPFALETIHDSSRQRIIRPDHGQTDALAFCERNECVVLADFVRHTRCNLRDATVSGRAKHCGHAW